jgi:hypothetical protein
MDGVNTIAKSLGIKDVPAPVVRSVSSVSRARQVIVRTLENCIPINTANLVSAAREPNAAGRPDGGKGKRKHNNNNKGLVNVGPAVGEKKQRTSTTQSIKAFFIASQLAGRSQHGSRHDLVNESLDNRSVDGMEVSESVLIVQEGASKD